MQLKEFKNPVFQLFAFFKKLKIGMCRKEYKRKPFPELFKKTKLSKRTWETDSFSILDIVIKANRLKSEGRDVIDLGLGEPDFDTPDFIKDKAIEAIKSGFTRYTFPTGTYELRNCISRKFKKDNELNYGPEQIVVSCGAKHSIFNTLFFLINYGDEVIIPSPYWGSYPEIVYLCQGKARFIKTKPENYFKISAEELKENISSKTRILILNSPSNPCGSVYLKKELEEIAKVCVSRRIYVISDEIYEKLIYDNQKHVSIASLNNDIYNLTITVNGLSKAYSMTGWRIGYLGAPLEIIESIAKIQERSTSNPNSIAQKAALAALNSTNDFIENMRQEFQKRRNYMMSRLDAIEELSYIRPQGAFYIFCKIPYVKIGSSELANRLLEEKQLLIIPGARFGRNDYVRISFTASLLQIEKGITRLKEWLEQLSNKLNFS